MFKKIACLIAVSTTLISCQFTETMTLNEDGSGRISVSMDMAEMMAMTQEFGKDSTAVKLDTIIKMKDVLREKKDSIATLPAAEQARLKKLENFNFRTLMDPDTGEMYFDVFATFKKVTEANELMSAFETSGDFMQGLEGSGTDVSTDKTSGGAVAVSFSYEGNTFVRDAYITDKEKHRIQMDSLKGAEAFMSSMKYKMKYVFPKKIVKSSVEDARFSLDGKTIEFERSFIEYMRNPDVTDL
ncbi:MAG: hypothetical protein K0U54_07955, partial [Bacteroidetes bacterium]|nr:hypothetical protein [Bacteroidota bacterium]